jgi:predicted RNase H-like nuclease (RuvC/YqgF family)
LSDFKIIETQEQFDEIMGKRLGKERDKFQKKLEEAEKTSSSKIAELQKNLDEMKKKAEEYAKADERISELQNKVKASETQSAKLRAVLTNGLDLSAVEFIKGETAEDIEKSAEQLKSLIGVKTGIPKRETKPTDSREEAYSLMAKNLFNKEG